MPDTGAGTQESGSGFRARDVSPSSFIFKAESNFSLFSSASGSVERCSFTSDAPDQDSLASEVSQRLTGHELAEDSSGPDLDPNKPKLVYKNSVNLSRKVQILDSSEAETTEDENLATVSARSSFSRALKECQDRRLRSEGLLNRTDRRTASLDLNISVSNPANSSSPRVGVMKKPSAAPPKTSAFPSPGTPNFRHPSMRVQKGWSSERIPSHSNASKRTVNGALLPYSNGRMPSKWEDAERWIFSPISGDSSIRVSTHQPQRRPRSKSGPLGPPGAAYYQMFSPAAPMPAGGNTAKLIANSPFSAGVLAADGLWIRNTGCDGKANFLIGMEPCMARSISIHGCSEMISQSSLPIRQDGRCNGVEDTANNISRDVSRRDMATQMSPDSSIQSSSERRSSFSLATPSILPLVEFESAHASKTESRDVPVDEPVTMTRWSKKNWSKNSRMGGGYINDWKRKAVNIGSATWEVAMETSRSISTIQREESRITAWENLQKAKAEAAIRKLEMKLEKKRSSSMDKIMNKLRSAQKKAQSMRSSVIMNESHQIERPSVKTLSFRRTRQTGSLSGCFTCHAF